MPGCGGSGCGCGGNCASSIPGFYLRGSLGGGGGGTGFVCVFSIRRPNGACASCHRRGRKGELVISHICVYGVSKTQNRRFKSIMFRKTMAKNEGCLIVFWCLEIGESDSICTTQKQIYAMVSDRRRSEQNRQSLNAYSITTCTAQNKQTAMAQSHLLLFPFSF